LSIVKEARTLMRHSFPGWNGIRQNLAHRGEFYVDPVGAKSHRITVTPGHYREYWNTLKGRTFTYSFEKQRWSYSLSQNSLQKLIAVRRKFFSAFPTPQSSAEHSAN